MTSENKNMSVTTDGMVEIMQITIPEPIDLDPEIAQIVHENFSELLDEEKADHNDVP